MKKLKLAALQLGAKEVLTREQLKKVLGGDGSIDGTCRCANGLDCSLFDGTKNYPGNCDSNWGGGSGGWMACGCSTAYGPYPIGNSSGISHCCI
jgi:hypothetical protein